MASELLKTTLAISISSAWREQAFHGECKTDVPELPAAAIFRICSERSKYGVNIRSVEHGLRARSDADRSAWKDGHRQLVVEAKTK
jgi:hypothetical protein